VELNDSFYSYMSSCKGFIIIIFLCASENIVYYGHLDGTASDVVNVIVYHFKMLKTHLF
jgi:hypothetical protein